MAVAVPLRERLSIAVRALFNPEDAAKAAFGLAAGIAPAGGFPPKVSDRTFLEFYKKSPLLRMVVGRVALSMAALRWWVAIPTQRMNARAYLREMKTMPPDRRAQMILRLKQSGELRELEEHPLLNLLYAPSSLRLYGSDRRKVTTAHLDLTGECLWILDRNGAGVPIMNHPVPKHWVRRTPTANFPFFEIQFGSWRPPPIPEGDVVWLKDVDPVNPYSRGTGIAQSLADELQTHEDASKHVSGFFRDRGIPSLLVAMTGAKREQMDDMEASWSAKVRRGFSGGYSPVFQNVPGPDITKALMVKELSQTFDNMQLVQLMSWERDIVIEVYNAPPEVFGIIENSNRATIQAADFLFNKNVIVPRAEYLREVMQERLIPEYDDRLLVGYDSPVEEDREHKLSVMQAAPWVPDVNEWRQEMSLEPKEGSEGELHGVPINIFLQPLEEQVPTTTPPAEGDRALSALKLPAAAEQKAGDTSAAEILRLIRRFEGNYGDEFLSAVESQLDDVDDKELERAIASGQVAAVLAVLSLATLADSFRDSLGKLIPPLYDGAGQIAADAASDLTGDKVSWAFGDEAAQNWIRQHTAETITDLDKSSKRGIRLAVERALQGEYGQEGLVREIKRHIGLSEQQVRTLDNFTKKLVEDRPDLSSAQIQRLIDDEYERLLANRAATIAFQETRTAAWAAQREAWRQGVKNGQIPRDARQQWLRTLPDPESECDSLHGQLQLIGQLFRAVSGVLYAQPPEPHVRCACILRLVLVS